MTIEKKPKGFDRAQNTAEEFLKDKEKTGYLLDEAIKKAARNDTALESVWADLQAVFRLVKAWIHGEYKEIPWQTLIFALAGVVYFVNPFDIVPDFIPGAGFLDDATVIGFVIRSIKKDIKLFLSWENSQA